MPPPVQTEIGKYRLIRKIATGGMAEVYLAQAAGPAGFQKTLVLKRILPHLAEDAGFVEMFLNEARLAALLNHPNIVQIFDLGEADGSYFIAMEYIDGPNLRMLCRKAADTSKLVPYEHAAKIIALACEGLGYAHDFSDNGEVLGLIHRDISPDNILLSRTGSVKVVDFGIAKAANQGHLTKTGTLKGKLAYMPPEQLRGKPLDRRADIFSLGVVLYEMLAGMKPFEATSEIASMQAILHDPPTPLRERRGDCPAEIAVILDRALEKERENRYPDCRSMQRDLEAFLMARKKAIGAFELGELVNAIVPPSPVSVQHTPLPRSVPQEIGGLDPVDPRSKSGRTPRPRLEPTPRPRPQPTPRPRPVPPTADLTPSGKLKITTADANAAPEPVADDDFVSLSQVASLPTREDEVAGIEGEGEADGAAPSKQKFLLGMAGVGGACAIIGGIVLFTSSGKPVRKPDASLPTPPPVQRVETIDASRPEIPEPPDASEPEQIADPPDAGGSDSADVGTRPSPTRPGKKGPRQPPADTPKANRLPATDPRPDAPEAPRQASLFIESDPPCSVTLDGRPVGTTPVDVRSVSPGSHVVVLSSREKGLSRQLNLTLAPGEERREKVKFAPGTLVFRVQPWAFVEVDGKPQGQTPIDPVTVYEGEHKVRLFNPELKKETVKNVTVRPGAKEIVKVNFHDE